MVEIPTGEMVSQHTESLINEFENFHIECRKNGIVANKDSIAISWFAQKVASLQLVTIAQCGCDLDKFISDYQDKNSPPYFKPYLVK